MGIKILVLVAICLIPLFIIPAFAEDADFHVYENSDMGLRLDYPSDWQVDDPLFGAVDFYSPPDGPNDFFTELMGVVIEYLNEPITLEEYGTNFLEAKEFS